MPSRNGNAWIRLLLLAPVLVCTGSWVYLWIFINWNTKPVLGRRLILELNGPSESLIATDSHVLASSVSQCQAFDLVRNRRIDLPFAVKAIIDGAGVGENQVVGLDDQQGTLWLDVDSGKASWYREKRDYFALAWNVTQVGPGVDFVYLVDDKLIHRKGQNVEQIPYFNRTDCNVLASDKKGMLFAGGSDGSPGDGKITAYDLEKGTIVWETPAPELERLVVAGSYVVALTHYGVRCYSAKNGSLRSQASLYMGTNPGCLIPSPEGGRIIVCDIRKTRCLMIPSLKSIGGKADMTVQEGFWRPDNRLVYFENYWEGKIFVADIPNDWRPTLKEK